MASTTVKISYRPGPLVRALGVARRLGVRFPAWFICWAVKRSGQVRLGNGPWMYVSPNLPLRGPQ